MTRPPLHPGMTFRQLSQWVWNISLDGKHVGTVSGDRLGGFTARDVDFHCIGRGYDSAEAAMQAWVPANTAGID